MHTDSNNKQKNQVQIHADFVVLLYVFHEHTYLKMKPKVKKSYLTKLKDVSGFDGTFLVIMTIDFVVFLISYQFPAVGADRETYIKNDKAVDPRTWPNNITCKN